MNDVRRPPRKSYTPVRIYAIELAYKAIETIDDLPADAEGDVTFRWDWRFVEETFVDILLGISISPTAERPESVQATLIGAFRLPTQPPEVSLDTFVSVNGPTMLMPYLREAISSLTGRGFYGSYVIPPINIHRLIAGMDPATTGRKQIAEDADLALVAARLVGDSATSGQLPKRKRKRKTER